jgi:hypothetical protein
MKKDRAGDPARSAFLFGVGFVWVSDSALPLLLPISGKEKILKPLRFKDFLLGAAGRI